MRLLSGLRWTLESRHYWEEKRGPNGDLGRSSRRVGRRAAAVLYTGKGPKIAGDAVA